MCFWGVPASATILQHSCLSLCNPLEQNRLLYSKWKRTFIAFIWGIVAWSAPRGYIKIKQLYVILNRPSYIHRQAMGASCRGQEWKVYSPGLNFLFMEGAPLHLLLVASPWISSLLIRQGQDHVWSVLSLWKASEAPGAGICCGRSMDRCAVRRPSGPP